MLRKMKNVMHFETWFAPKKEPTYL